MTTNLNLQLLMEKMFDDEETLAKITETDDMEELYRICLTIQDGYTLQEFVDFFENLVYICKEEANEIDKLEENQLKDISGGASAFNRMTASVLASLSFVTANGVGASGVSTVDAQSGGSVSLRSAEPGEKEEAENTEVQLRKMDTEEEEEKLSIGAKAKKWLSNAADTVWDNKGKILAASVGLIVGGGLLVGESGQISENINKWRSEKFDKKRLENRRRELIHKDPTDPKVAQELYTIKKQLAAYEGSEKSTSLTDKLILAGAAASGLGALWGGVKKAYGHFENASKVMTTASNMYWSISGNREMYRALKHRIEMWFQTKFSNFDYNDGGKRLDALFKEKIHGQESAKKDLKKFYNIFANALEDEKNGIATQQKLAPQILVLNGPSGTGKTFMAQLLSSCLTDVDPYIVSAGAVMKEAEQFYRGDVATAFLAGGQRMGTSKGDRGTSYNNLSSFLRTTQDSVRVVIVDEYDKMYTSGTKHPLDETFRDILANNVNDPYTMEKLDLSKTIFICTTNETKASLQGRIVSDGRKLWEKEVDEKGNLVMDGQNQSYIEPIRDETGTQTLVPHDPSFVQRIAGATCYFDSLEHEDYLRIAHDALDDDPSIASMEDLKKIGGTDRVILSNRIHYKLAGVEIDNDGYELIAKHAEKMPSAARAIVGAGGNRTGTVAGNLDSAIITQCSKWLAAGYSVKNMKLKAIPKEVKNSAGLLTVEFDIKCVGYKD